ncbi:hypothetical protein Bca52824_035642 [Brassica carinata]|uniref:Uncharacterized protein n=1 Tax=Brassica carinata TaxID=52824 RepID=A0A8X7S5R3_BRACI|nr:hypothetical protein Bca52824_035642 [Brassica carinata]
MIRSVIELGVTRRDPVDPPWEAGTTERNDESAELPIPSPVAETVAPPQKKKSKKRPHYDSGVAETLSVPRNRRRPSLDDRSRLGGQEEED